MYIIICNNFLGRVLAHSHSINLFYYFIFTDQLFIGAETPNKNSFYVSVIWGVKSFSKPWQNLKSYLKSSVSGQLMKFSVQLIINNSWLIKWYFFVILYKMRFNVRTAEKKYCLSTAIQYVITQLNLDQSKSLTKWKLFHCSI